MLDCAVPQHTLLSREATTVNTLQYTCAQNLMHQMMALLTCGTHLAHNYSQ